MKMGAKNIALSGGILLCILDILWLYSCVERWYCQEYVLILYLFMIPNWILYIGIGFSLSSFWLSLRMVLKKMVTFKVVLLNIILFLIYESLFLLVGI